MYTACSANRQNAVTTCQRLFAFALWVVGGGWFAECSPSPIVEPVDKRLPVYVGIPPAAYLAQRIGGERVSVEVLLQPGREPHTFQPTPQQVLKLQRAVIFFKIGLPFENVLTAKVARRGEKPLVVDITEGVKKRLMEDACDKHHHGASDDVSPVSFDPHIWLSPLVLKKLAENVAEVLCRVDSGHAAEYRRNLVRLSEEIELVHRRVEKKLAPYRGRTFYVYHPGFGYFADAYGLKEAAIQVGGRPPTPQRLRTLIEQARRENVKTIFVQPRFDPHPARNVAKAVGGRVVMLDGLKQDVLAEIEEIAAKLEEAFQES